MRSWLEALPPGHGAFGRIRDRSPLVPGGSTSAIARGLEQAGYRAVMKGQRFVVKGKWGPLRDGELERARRWGAELAHAQV